MTHSTVTHAEALRRLLAATKLIDYADCKDETVWQALGAAQGTAEGVLRDGVAGEVEQLQARLDAKESRNKTLLSEVDALAARYFHDGVPPNPFGKEWFIAVLDNGEKVVLRELPEEYSYDYRTVDETYYKAFRIKKWMQFPDSEYITHAGSVLRDGEKQELLGYVSVNAESILKEALAEGMPQSMRLYNDRVPGRNITVPVYTHPAPSLQAVGAVPSKEIPTELLKALNKHCCENVAWIRHAWMEYVATAPQPAAAPSGDAWQPIETAPRNGIVVRLYSDDAGGEWVGKFDPVFQSGYRPANPWRSMMLNMHHLESAKNWIPTHWAPMQKAAAITATKE